MSEIGGERREREFRKKGFSPQTGRQSNPEPSGDRQEGTSGEGSGFDDGEEAEAKHRFESHKSDLVRTEAIEVYRRLSEALEKRTEW